VRIAGQPYQVLIDRDGFGRIYRELAGVRGYIFRRDRGEWLIALRLGDYFDLLRGLSCEVSDGNHEADLDEQAERGASRQPRVARTAACGPGA
jgi:hypothetical protein